MFFILSGVYLEKKIFRVLIVRKFDVVFDQMEDLKVVNDIVQELN